MTTSKFKQHFQQHLLEGEAYDITHCERYEWALDDPSLLPGDDPGNPSLVAQLRAVSAHLQGLDVRMQGIEGRMASIEELLQARGGAVSTSAPPRAEPATSTPDSSASSDDEDIDMNTTESLAQEHPMEPPAVTDDVTRRTRLTHGRVLRAIRNLS
ncbi:hypothetical protein PC119_g1876 [Phytophthora cactorum]|uniref:Uncharacterized protein n=1 Tax=Phytophthora cactorum TaxID=29920 RepID=A0A8T1EHN3_9STRA|nr:hypothetical protein PC117_g3103 [Phytophthora cactorum]KAG3039809.1 hypothetical protein PC119_g1876 [Phytophthora cactorum]